MNIYSVLFIHTSWENKRIESKAAIPAVAVEDSLKIFRNLYGEHPTILSVTFVGVYSPLN